MGSCIKHRLFAGAFGELLYIYCVFQMAVNQRSQFEYCKGSLARNIDEILSNTKIY